MEAESEPTPWALTRKAASDRQRAHQLLEQKDADSLIRSLTELEAFYAVKSLGPDEASPYLAVLTHEQVRAVFDIEVWHHNRFEPEDLLIWLAAFREVSLPCMQEAAGALDKEVLALLFKRRLHVVSAAQDVDPQSLPDWARSQDPALQPLIRTPDQRFLIAARTVDLLDELEDEARLLDEEDRKAVLGLVDELYRTVDFEDIAGLLRIAETDMQSQLSEDGLRFRNARLEDLGFPSLARAATVYTPIDRRRLSEADPHPEPASFRLPALYARSFDEGLLSRAMGQIADPDLVTTLEAELVTLSNAVCVADGVEPGNLEQMTDTLRRVRAYLELALSMDAAPETGDLAAAGRLKAHGLRTLFGIGYGATIEIQQRARRVLRSQLWSDGDDNRRFLPDTDAAFIAALLRRRPSLDDGPGKTRPFRTPADLETAHRQLEELEGLTVLATQLTAPLDGPQASVPEAEWTTDTFLGTLCCRAALGLALNAYPIPIADLQRLEWPLDVEAIQNTLFEAVGQSVPGLQARVRVAASSIETALGGQGGAVDPRFVDALLVESSDEP